MYRIKRYGWLPDPFDHRDLTINAAKVKQALAATTKATDGRMGRGATRKQSGAIVDLREQCSLVEDQGEIGSCTAQAVVGLLELLWKQAHRRHLEASRLFLYKTTRNVLGWTGDTGAFVRTAIKAARLFGVCPEDHWDYTDDPEEFDHEPPAFCYAYAQNYKAMVYYRLKESVEELEKSLDQGIPFAFGFTCFESIDDLKVARTGKIPFPDANEKNVGGHAVMAVGYNRKSKEFIIRNSWGRGWGDEGYGYLPYKYFDMKLADDCWCIVKSDYELP